MEAPDRFPDGSKKQSEVRSRHHLSCSLNSLEGGICRELYGGAL